MWKTLDYIFQEFLPLHYISVTVSLQSMKAPDLKEKLEESEKLLKEMRKTWEEKLAETEKIQVVGVFGLLFIFFPPYLIYPNI